MKLSAKSVRARLLIATSALVLMGASVAHAQDREPITIAPQALTSALQEFGSQTASQVMFSPDLIASKRTAGVSAATDEQIALAELLAGTGLDYRREGDVYLIVRADQDPQSGSAVGDGAEVDALIVTAQKKEEDIQDVPIAISAFTQTALEQQKIEGGFDLLKAIPNVTFSKSNFSSYNFSIRGIGTKAVSATTDPAVAVAFNSSTIIQNRLFEQEYFDVERVEVLRGPQGTLYGRNATAGVINVISAKPDLNEFEGFIKGEVGNYDTKRLSAMVNIPLVEDKLAIRLAGALTSRDGYDFNTVTNEPVNGRELWSTRLTIGFEPNERLRGNLVWERFEEDDNRSRTGKQLCHRFDGPEMVGDTPTGNADGEIAEAIRPMLFSTGCKAGSLYDEQAFGVPNGIALPFVLSFIANSSGYAWGYLPSENPNNGWGVDGVNLLQVRDPYDGVTQSRDLRSIASIRDPIYRANADILQLNLDFDVTDSLTLVSQTIYVEDKVYSFQDFNRFNTQPIFRDTSQFVPHPAYGVSPYLDAAPGGIFCDPQLGCSNRMAGFDISRSDARQFGQEFRLQSSFDGPINFSAGVNYTDFKGVSQYFVMNNVLTAVAMSIPFNGSGYWDTCDQTGFLGTGEIISMEDPRGTCPYIDPNPVESINGDGHNYYRSVNPFHTKSAAAFGELYWEMREDLKLTAGLRYTKDKKRFTPIPTQLLLAPTFIGGGTVARGYPAKPDINLEWGEWTGRVGLDWQPEFAWSDETLLYAFYSRGYKGGGANPPTPGFATTQELLDLGIATPEMVAIFPNAFPILRLSGLEYGATFAPEFVNAFEIGTKNAFMGGALTLNAHAFYYDYTDYQVSQIRNRTAVNENFDATVWGLEFETLFAPTRDLRINANLGYLDTSIADGEKSIDIMNRNLGDPDYTVTRSWVQIPANCVIPTGVAESWLQSAWGIGNFHTLCGGVGGILNLFGQAPTDPATGQPFKFSDYPDLNGGSGFFTDLSGNELPNAPHWTANIGAQYGYDFLEGWRATVRADAYWQSQSWHRVYNLDPYDKLHGWYNLNLSVWIERPEDGLKIELYAKNILDETPITDAFLNSDDAALTTNVFTLDPRLIGLSIRKTF